MDVVQWLLDNRRFQLYSSHDSGILEAKCLAKGLQVFLTQREGRRGARKGQGSGTESCLSMEEMELASPPASPLSPRGADRPKLGSRFRKGTTEDGLEAMVAAMSLASL